MVGIANIDELEKIEKKRFLFQDLFQDFKNWFKWLWSDKVSLILFIIAIVSLIYGLWLNWQSQPLPYQAYHKPSQIMVDIGGAVNRPGVYYLHNGNRVIDLINKAGGLDNRADLYWTDSSLNKARFLIDGEKIYIPFKLVNRRLISDKISLNYASLAELDSLPGIGKTTARKIISGRPFSRVEEVVQKGIINHQVWLRIKNKISL